MYPHRENVEAGGLVSYGTDRSDAYRQIRELQRLLRKGMILDSGYAPA